MAEPVDSSDRNTQSVESFPRFRIQKDGHIISKISVDKKVKSSIFKPLSIKTALQSLLRFRHQPKPQQVFTNSRLEALPVELMRHITDNLDCASVLRMSEVSKKFYQFCRKDDYRWRHLVAKDFGEEHQKTTKQDSSYYELYKILNQSEKCLATGQACAKYFKGHDDGVKSLAYFNNCLVSGGYDGTIKVWDIKTRQCQLVLDAHMDAVSCLRAYPERLLSCSIDSGVVVWSKNFKPIFSFGGHEDSVLDVCQAGKYILSSSKDGVVCVWDEIGRPVRILDSLKVQVKTMDAHGTVVALVASNSTIHLYDAENNKFLNKIDIHPFNLSTVQFDGKRVFGAGIGPCVTAWNATTGRLIFTGTEHIHIVRTLSISHNTVISGAFDKAVCIWDSVSGRCKARYQHDEHFKITALVWQAPFIFCASKEGNISIIYYGNHPPQQW